MSKIFLQDSFKEFCESKKLEVNLQQVKIINSLEKFFGNGETVLSRFFKKKKYIYLSDILRILDKKKIKSKINKKNKVKAKKKNIF